MHSEYTTIAKLILRASKKVSAPSLRRDPAKAFGLAWDANVLTLRKLTKARRTLEGNGEHFTYFLKMPNNQGT
jgi:hypothetical protein